LFSGEVIIEYKGVMNDSHNENLRNIALVSAEKIGKVEVDHGETSCKTPLAKKYIIKTRKRKEKKQR